MNQKGQTSVEYILLLVVVVSVSTGVFKVLEDKIAGPNGIASEYLASFNESFTTNYKTFTLRR